MTPAERALLLAVAKSDRAKAMRGKGTVWTYSLHDLIEAVEAEAAFAAEDESELAEVAAKAEVIENIPLPAEFQAFFDTPIPPASALDGWQPSHNRAVMPCPTCNGLADTNQDLAFERDLWKQRYEVMEANCEAWISRAEKAEAKCDRIMHAAQEDDNNGAALSNLTQDEIDDLLDLDKSACSTCPDCTGKKENTNDHT